MAGSAEERSPLDIVHRRAADCAGIRRFYARGDAASAAPKDGTELPGHVHQRKEACVANLREYAQPIDEKACRTIYVEHRLPGMSWKAAEARIIVGKVCRTRHRRDRYAAA